MGKLKKAGRFGKKIFWTALILAFIAIASFYFSDYFYHPAFVRYTEFGINIPVNYSIHGIDVSRYQKEISWQDVSEMKVKDIGISFVFIKATEGADMADARFLINMAGAKNAGITRGAYHFFIGSQNGKAQAENFIQMADLKKGDLPPVLDAEQTNGALTADLQQRIAEWLAVVEKKYKTKPIIYSNIDFYNSFLKGRFDDYPLWVAHYYVKERPRIERSWAFWQHNEKGNVTGIRTNVDFNVFSGDSAAFQKLLLK